LNVKGAASTWRPFFLGMPKEDVSSKAWVAAQADGGWYRIIMEDRGLFIVSVQFAARAVPV
jgi:hypothetical protein